MGLNPTRTEKGLSSVPLYLSLVPLRDHLRTPLELEFLVEISMKGTRVDNIMGQNSLLLPESQAALTYVDECPKVQDNSL